MRENFGRLICVSAILLAGACGARRPYIPRLAPPESFRPSAPFQLPLKNPQVLSPFGKRGRRFHTGIDIRGRVGGKDKVFASRSGRVIEAGTRKGYGRWVIIRHSDGSVSRYAHLRKIFVRKNEEVKSLEPIGTVGSSGRASTAHLHFELIAPAGGFLDPADYLFRKKKD